MRKSDLQGEWSYESAEEIKSHKIEIKTDQKGQNKILKNEYEANISSAATARSVHLSLIFCLSTLPSLRAFFQSSQKSVGAHFYFPTARKTGQLPSRYQRTLPLFPSHLTAGQYGLSPPWLNTCVCVCHRNSYIGILCSRTWFKFRDWYLQM